MSEPELLRVEQVVKHFPSRSGAVRAVDGVSFSLAKGETLALVGESGCGKSTVGRLLLRLLEPSAGTIRFRGLDLARARPGEIRVLRRDMQIVFQDPYTSLNPTMSIEAILREPFEIHRIGTRTERKANAIRLMERVGLEPERINSRPAAFSGGQRQRIAIARALALDPALLVCDEPVSSLDVSIQAQILNLLRDLQEELHLAFVFISHDLSVVHHLAHRVAVMYLGKIVELAECDRLFARPSHPYTVALLSAIPHPDPRGERSRERIVLAGEAPSPTAPPSGCRFRTRCWKAQEVCTEVEPPLVARQPGQWVACHFPEGSDQ
jgi:oligopeptide/dipeptide ABC transporter ATP-binding protein